jgi:hypothetical protein
LGRLLVNFSRLRWTVYGNGGQIPWEANAA